MEKNQKFISIAIDGPSGAGKSTIARIIAGKLGFLYVDTGALYRAVGLGVYRKGILPYAVDKIAAAVSEFKVEIMRKDGKQLTILNGEDVSEEIRSEKMSKYASAVSAVPEVRKHLLGTQREIAARNNVIMDGRDIATVVLPGADIKIFLTASPEDRAKRRFYEQREKGGSESYDDILSAIISRDTADSSRAAAPLRKHPEAVLVDTTGNTLEKSVDILVELIKGRLEVAV